MIRLASYKGPGRWGDKLIRWWTGGPYSHSELIIGNIMYSASQYEGQVRAMWAADMTPEHWDIVDLPEALDEQAALAFLNAQIGKRYDWLGIVLSQVLPLNRHDKGAWFCSELCYRALQIAGLGHDIKPQAVHPNRLHRIAIDWRTQWAVS